MNKKLDKLVGQGASNMKSQPHLTITPHGIYQYRLIVPKHLRDILGRKVVKKSLKTRDKIEAKKLAWKEDVYWHNVFANAKSKLKASALPLNNISSDEEYEVTRHQTTSDKKIEFSLKIVSSIPDEHINQMANLYLRTQLEYDEEIRTLGIFDSAVKRELTENFYNTINNPIFKNAIAFDENIELYFDFVQPFVESVCKIKFETLNDETKRKLTRECLKSYQKAGLITQKRNEEWIDSEEAMPLSKTFKPSKNSWNSIFEDWKLKQISRPAKTIETYNKSLEEFKKFVKSKDIETVEIQDVINYRKELITGEKYQPNTIQNKLSHLCAIFENAKINDKISKNVFEGRTSIEQGLRSEKSRIPFQKADIEAIFQSVIFTSQQSINKWQNTTNRFLIAIAFATGARPEEIAQLRVEDVKSQGNLHSIRISHLDLKGNVVGSIKNQSSIREIPIHKDLINAGFLKFVEKQKNLNYFYLFNDLAPNKYQKRYAKWGDWFNRYCKKNNLLTDKKTFYSFRDTFSDACRNSNVNLPVMNKFMGHSNDNMSDNYGVGHELSTLNDQMQKVSLISKIPLIET